MAATLARAVAFTAVGYAAGNNPLFLVPGLTGSALEVQMHKSPMPHWECTSDTDGKWKTVWLAIEELLPREKDCLVARLSLSYDATTDTYSNYPGVTLRALTSTSGGSENLLYEYEFSTLMKHVKSTMNYTLGSDLFLAPYDWRLAGDAHAEAKNGVGGFYPQLKEMIEQAVKSNGKRAVVLSHSLGCPTMLYFFHNFVSEEWRAANIQGWIALSGPWLGSTMQVNAYLGGWDLDMPTWLLPHDYVKSVQVNASSGVWLSPSPMAFGDHVVARTPTKNYTSKDLPQLISLIGKQAGGEQATTLQAKLANDLPAIQRPPVNVPVHNWYSTGVKTSERYEYDTEIDAGFNKAPTKTIYGDGDGIVNHISARVIEDLWPKENSAPVVTQVFPGASHFGMLSDKRVMDALSAYLSSSTSVIV